MAERGWDAAPDRGEFGVEFSALSSRYLRERVARREISRKTATNCAYVYRRFAAFIGDPPVTRVRRGHVERWLEHRLARVSTATVAGDLSALRALWRWLEANRHTRSDPTAGVASPRRPRHVPRNVPTPEVGRLLGAVPDLRGELIVSLMVQEGLRCMEVAALELGDIDPERQLMLVKGKRGFERIVPITDATWRVLLRYLVEHPAVAGPVVRSYKRPTRSLDAKTVSALVSAWMSGAGIKRFARDGRSAHALRHTAATDVLDGGADIREVKEMLGHRSLASTQVYLGFDVKNLRAAMEGRDYRNGHGLQNGLGRADNGLRPPPESTGRIPARRGSRD